VSEYLSGADLITTAVLKLDTLGPDFGALLVEGEDDRRCLAARHVREEQLLVCDGKERLLEAYSANTEARIVFLADCDYDVPTGALNPEPNLVLTSNPSLETDLVASGVVGRVVQELVPRPRWHGTLDATAASVVDHAVRLAEPLGKLRYAAREQALPLRLNGIRERLRRYRRADGGGDLRRMVDVLAGQAEQPNFDRDQLFATADSVVGGLLVCDGHDLEEALKCVLKDDLGVSKELVGALPQLLRAFFDDAAFRSSDLARRLERWEETVGVRVLLSSDNS
jgi:hypothetical protein